MLSGLDSLGLHLSGVAPRCIWKEFALGGVIILNFFENGLMRLEYYLPLEERVDIPHNILLHCHLSGIPGANRTEFDRTVELTRQWALCEMHSWKNITKRAVVLYSALSHYKVLNKDCIRLICSLFINNEKMSYQKKYIRISPKIKTSKRVF